MSTKKAMAIMDLVNRILYGLPHNMRKAVRRIVDNKMDGAETPKEMALAICDALEVAKLIVGDYTSEIKETRRYLLERTVTFGENKVYVI